MNKVLIVIIAVLIGSNILFIGKVNKVEAINDSISISLKDARNTIAIKNDALNQSIKRIERVEAALELYKIEYNKACNKIVKLTGNTTGVIDLN